MPQGCRNKTAIGRCPVAACRSEALEGAVREEVLELRLSWRRSIMRTTYAVYALLLSVFCKPHVSSGPQQLRSSTCDPPKPNIADMARPEPTIPAGLSVVNASQADNPALLESLFHLHATCILNDHTMATFIPPLSSERMRARWRTFLDEIKSGKRIIVIFTCPTANRSAPPYTIVHPFDSEESPFLSPDQDLAGTVSLSMPPSETGPFRGIVQNLFVSPYHRRKGLARQMLAELERQALSYDRWNLMLDTMQGSAAETLYHRLGWEKLGVVRDYGIDPRDGRLLDEVFFVKDLRRREG